MKKSYPQVGQYHHYTLVDGYRIRQLTPEGLETIKMPPPITSSVSISISPTETALLWYLLDIHTELRTAFKHV